MRGAEALPAKIAGIKITCAESWAIARKKQLYSSVSWTAEQQKQFDDFWLDAYGKKIPNKWHRLYQSVSGKFCVDYIPEMLYTTKIEPYLNDRRYAVALEDKSMVETLSAGCGCVVPDTVAVCSGGRLFNQKRQPICLQTAIRDIQTAGAVVIKPTVGSSSGKGIRFFESLSDKNEYEIGEILGHFGKDYIIQKKVEQHPAFAAFNSSSVNTIRITTFLVNGEIHHMPIAFRIGRQGKNVDNIHAGGIGVGVLDDGALLPVGFELGYGDSAKKHAMHPDSNVEFADYTLPSVPQIIQSAYQVHSRFPHIGIISWDYTVDIQEMPVLLEANIMGQGIWFPQMIHGKGAFGEYTKQILETIRK